MKKLSAFLNTPARLVVAVALLILLVEFLIMLLIEGIHGVILKDVVLEKRVFEFLDPIMFILIVSPALFLLIFKPMRAQQANLEQRAADILSTNEELQRTIFEHKVAEAKLAESERRFRAIATSANAAIISADSAGRVVDWNPGAERLFGYTEAEMIGQTLTVLMPERFRTLHSEGLARVAAGGTPHVIGKTVELAGLRKDGSEFPLELSLAQWQAAEGQFFTGIVRDITERKQASDSLRKLALAVEQSPNSIIITDLDANIEYANATFVNATGYSLAEVIGQNPRLLHSGKNTRATYDDLWAHLSRGEVWEGELINRRKDGSEYIESVLISPVRQPDGRVSNYLAIKADITEFKQAESTRLEQLDELRRWHEATSGREKRILVLKHEVNELLGQTGQPPRYPSAESQDLSQNPTGGS